MEKRRWDSNLAALKFTMAMAVLPLRGVAPFRPGQSRRNHCLAKVINFIRGKPVPAVPAGGSVRRAFFQLDSTPVFPGNDYFELQHPGKRRKLGGDVAQTPLLSGLSVSPSPRVDRHLEATGTHPARF